MSKKELNLEDFNTEHENLLADNNNKVIQGRPKKDQNERLTKKLQVGVTEKEYDDLYNEFLNSEFPNFGSYLRLKLKKADVI